MPGENVITLEIDIGDGLLGCINVEPECNYTDIASDFVLRYALPESLVPAIADYIDTLVSDLTILATPPKLSCRVLRSDQASESDSARRMDGSLRLTHLSTTTKVMKPDHVRSAADQNRAAMRLSMPRRCSVTANDDATGNLSIRRKFTDNSRFEQLYNNGVAIMNRRRTTNDAQLGVSALEGSRPQRSVSRETIHRLYYGGLEKRRENLVKHYEKALEEKVATDPECTFHPSILDRSRRMSQREGVIERLYDTYHKTDSLRRQAVAAEAEKQEMSRCPFRPDLTQREHVMSRRIQEKLNVLYSGDTVSRRLAMPRTYMDPEDIGGSGRLVRSPEVRRADAERALGPTTSLLNIL